MDGIKKRGIEILGETQKQSGEILESAAEMRKQSEMVSSIVEGISLNDTETKEILEQVKREYSGSFETSFEQEIQAPADETGDRIKEESGVLEEELGNVRGGIGQLERAQGITEIGQEGAETGKRELENEAGEYSGTIDKLWDIKETQDKEIADNAKKMGAMFRMSR